MTQEVFKETEEKMKKVVEFFKKEIGSLRAGRASVSLLEGITVEYYGSKLPIQQIATITIPQPSLIIIQPWDKSVIDKITKAIQMSNLGLNPIADANVIKVPIPPLSEERRKEITKILHKMEEEAKVELREIRRKANETLKNMEKEKKISEDDFYRGRDEIQKLTDKYIEEIEELTEKKEKEIMEE
ncbi:MAG: ribosome recycling factor [Candidatus Omnitrophota bacterium]|nr:MAG: ribosome recycling factor [Candidatus Omnitrophota bacterium]HDN97583.1 ribosome recycling factor [bacterium]